LEKVKKQNGRRVGKTLETKNPVFLKNQVYPVEDCDTLKTQTERATTENTNMSKHISWGKWLNVNNTPGHYTQMGSGLQIFREKNCMWYLRKFDNETMSYVDLAEPQKTMKACKELAGMEEVYKTIPSLLPTETEPTNEETSDMRHERMPHDVQLREETTVQDNNTHENCGGTIAIDGFCLKCYTLVHPTRVIEVTNDPRDTNYLAPTCQNCGCTSDEAIPAGNICCYPETIATDEEIANLAGQFNMELAMGHHSDWLPMILRNGNSQVPFTPMTDSELNSAVATEIHGEKQQNTQILVRVETFYGKAIPGIHSLETFLQRGWEISPNPLEIYPEVSLLFREYAPNDRDWLIAYAAQGGGV
jgi:hypothetical protein